MWLLHRGHPWAGGGEIKWGQITTGFESPTKNLRVYLEDTGDHKGYCTGIEGSELDFKNNSLVAQGRTEVELAYRSRGIVR